MNKIVLFSDFSDTIAQPLHGSKFPPFEEELAVIVSQEILESDKKEIFLNECKKAYSQFLEIRKDSTISYEDKMKIWLRPFKDLLAIKHISQLTETFQLNPRFLFAAKLVSDGLQLSSLDITITSGTLKQIIEAFLIKPELLALLKERSIKFSIEATELILSDTKFTGRIEPVGKHVYGGANVFPDRYLIFGDDAMETFDFGEHLLNVQSFDQELIKRRIHKQKI